MGLLFSLGVILFTGWRWWRILLLVVSASFVVLIGPSRIYLGDHAEMLAGRRIQGKVVFFGRFVAVLRAWATLRGP